MPLTSLLPGDPPAFERFRLQGRLGATPDRGAFLAFDGMQAVVLTVVMPRAAGDPAERARFAAEVASARRVRSPHVSRLLDAAPDSPQPWRTGEYVEGADLGTAVQEHGPLPPHRVQALAAALAAALDDLAACGVVHGGLNPADIVLAWDGPRLVDTGLGPARLATAEPGWLPPEQIAGQLPTAASDVHAWAAVVVFAATGQVPWVGPTAEARAARVGREAPDLTGLPPVLLPLIAAALAADPAARPAAAALVGPLRTAPPLTPPPGSLPAAPTEPQPQPGFPLAQPGFPLAQQGFPPPPQGSPPPQPGFTLPPGPPGAPGPLGAPGPTRPGVAAYPVGAPPAPRPRRNRVPLVAAGIVAAVLVAGGVTYAATSGGGKAGPAPGPSVGPTATGAAPPSPPASSTPTETPPPSPLPPSPLLPSTVAPPPPNPSAPAPATPAPVPPPPTSFRTRYDGGFAFVVPTDWVQIAKGKDANGFTTVSLAGLSGSAQLGYLMCPDGGCPDAPLDSYGRLLPRGVRQLRYDRTNGAITFLYTVAATRRTEKGALKVLRDGTGTVVEIAFLDVFVRNTAIRDRMVTALVRSAPGTG